MSKTGCLQRGRILSATSIKVLALVIMTIDHIGIIMLTTGNTGLSQLLNGTAADTFRLIGRMAAPLFLFVLSESFQKTSNQKRFFIRLLLAAEFMGILNILVSQFLLADIFIQSNIFHSFVWVVGISLVLNEASAQYRNKAYGKAAILTVAMILVFTALCWFQRWVSRELNGVQLGILGSFFRTPENMDYSVGFLLTGVAWCLIRTKRGKCLLYFSLCLLSFLGLFDWLNSWLGVYWFDFLGSQSRTLVFVLPIIALYSGRYGKYGRKLQYAFYLYYPLHYYLIIFLAEKLSA